MKVRIWKLKKKDNSWEMLFDFDTIKDVDKLKRHTGEIFVFNEWGEPFKIRELA